MVKKKILNVKYPDPNTRAFMFVKETSFQLTLHIDPQIQIVGDINILLSPTEMSSKPVLICFVPFQYDDFCFILFFKTTTTTFNTPKNNTSTTTTNNNNKTKQSIPLWHLISNLYAIILCFYFPHICFLTFNSTQAVLSSVFILF